jgi:hypothetical protein
MIVGRLLNSLLIRSPEAATQTAHRADAQRLREPEPDVPRPGAHRVQRTAFSKWVTPLGRAEAALLSEADALAQIGPLARFASRPRSRPSAT